MRVVRENGVLWRVSTVGASESMKADLCTFCCVLRRTSHADGGSCYVEPLFGKADMGSLVHSRECGKAAAVSVPSFEADLVADD